PPKRSGAPCGSAVAPAPEGAVAHVLREHQPRPVVETWPAACKLVDHPDHRRRPTDSPRPQGRVRMVRSAGSPRALAMLILSIGVALAACSPASSSAPAPAAKPPQAAAPAPPAASGAPGTATQPAPAPLSPPVPVKVGSVGTVAERGLF